MEYDREKLVVLVKEGAAVYNNNIFQEHRPSSANVIENWRKETSHNMNNGDGTSTGENGQSYVYNPFLIAAETKFRPICWHKTVFIILILIIVILSIGMIAMACKGYTSVPVNVCKTKECIRSAANLLQSMDPAVDPCDDFYQFVCGNWADEHTRPDSMISYDWFNDKQIKLLRSVSSYLQANVSNSDPETIVKLKTMYTACMDLEAINELGFAPLLGYLEEYKLPRLPSFLNKSENGNSTTEFDWIESLVKIKKSMGLDIFIGLDVLADPINRTINRFGIGSPATRSLLPFKEGQKLNNNAKKKVVSDYTEQGTDETKEEDSEETSEVYYWYIQEVLTNVILFVEPETNVEEIHENLRESALEILRISNFINELRDANDNSTNANDDPLEDYLNLSIEELQESTDELIDPKSFPIWEKVITIMFESIENRKFDIKADKILTTKSDLEFLQEIIQFVTEKPLPNIELFMWWTIVDELITHTTKEMRNLNNEYTEMVIKTEGTTARSLRCTSVINELLGLAVSYSIADDKFLEETRPNVESMLSNMQAAFGSLVKETTWMDETTKAQTLDKSANIKSFIGYPDWILNKTMLDEYYSEIEIKNNTHLDNMMGILEWKMHKKLISLYNPDNSIWDIAPSNVNAFYDLLLNSISVPIAILQYPFYNLGLEALNYGAIGTILGHELTHGFDNNGRMYDKFGNIRQWWTNRTITEYINRTECFIEQYGNFYLSDIGEYVDGEISLSENIADNGGFRKAYLAYNRHLSKNGPEKSLPGFENYTNEQMFFISFGNLWCETYTPAGTQKSLKDTHCPGQMRLRGTLSNSEEFSSAFGCQKGSGMYPTEDRCKIW